MSFYRVTNIRSQAWGRQVPARRLRHRRTHGLAQSPVLCCATVGYQNLLRDFSRYRRTFFTSAGYPGVTDDEFGPCPTWTTNLTSNYFYVAAPVGSEFDALPATWVVWLKPSSLGGGFYAKDNFFGRCANSGSGRGFMAYLTSDGRFHVRFDNNGASSTTISSSTGVVVVDRWVCLACVMRSGGTTELYADGVLVGSGATVSWSMNGQNLIWGYSLSKAISADSFVGMVGPTFWFDQDVGAEWLGLLYERPWEFFEPDAFMGFDQATVEDVEYTWEDALAFSGGEDPQEERSDGLVWSDAYTRVLPPEAGATLVDVLQWAGGPDVVPTVIDLLVWDQEPPNGYVVPQSFDRDVDGLLWGDRFIPDVNELATRRYRR